MTKIFEQRCKELSVQIKNFKNKIRTTYPLMKKARVIQFTLKQTRKGFWKCQCVGLVETIDISLCKKSTTLLKRLSYLAGRQELKFAQDSENSNEFHIMILSNEDKGTKGQLQILF